MIKPKPIKKGAKVAVVAPSSPINASKLKKAIDVLISINLDPQVMKSCRYNNNYLSGSDEQRALDINLSFIDKSIEGIFCLRGGYGSQRILPLLDYEAIRDNPKHFSGYSDITALHTVFNQYCGFITYHAPMIGTTLLKKELDEYTKTSFLKNIFKPINTIDYNLPYLISGKTNGILTGGNLSLIVSSIGTPYEIDIAGKILFIEEVNEEPYKIDRMLTQLRLSGKIQTCAGIVLGSFTNCKSEDNNINLLDIFFDCLKPYNIPTLYNLFCGHSLPNITLPMGAHCHIKNNSLRILA